MKRLVSAMVVTSLLLMAGSVSAAGSSASSPATSATPATPVAPAAQEVKAEPDTDGDGLSDWQERYKYLTDPKKADTDGDGVPDGDWEERREKTYSIRARMRIIGPWDTSVMNDDYQDVRVLSETKDYLTFEVVLYPKAKAKEGISSIQDWQKRYATMQDYLKPGPTTNWDAQMQKDLLAELRQAGINPATLSDRALVERVSEWAMRRSKALSDRGPVQFFVEYQNGKVQVIPELQKTFDWYHENTPTSVLFDQFLFGKSMYYGKVHAGCTSTHAYIATILRALGIPTRILSTLRLFDGNDPAQWEMVKKGITDPTILGPLEKSITKGMADHFLLDVYVGGRWTRLNYNELGASNLMQTGGGMMIHINTFRDYNEIDLPGTWGRRLSGLSSPRMPSINLYQLLEVSDQGPLKTN